jgi:hypothetical protein
VCGLDGEKARRYIESDEIPEEGGDAGGVCVCGGGGGGGGGGVPSVIFL